MPTARLAHARDLPPLLALFDVAEVSAAAQPRERAESIWQDILAPWLLVGQVSAVVGKRCVRQGGDADIVVFDLVPAQCGRL
jgi:hypothetical protein